MWRSALDLEMWCAAECTTEQQPAKCAVEQLPAECKQKTNQQSKRLCPDRMAERLSEAQIKLVTQTLGLCFGSFIDPRVKDSLEELN